MDLKSDQILDQIAEYVIHPPPFSSEAYETAALCLADSLGCALLSLDFPECTKLLGPVIDGTVVPKGCPIPGTPYKLDPIRAAFNIGTMVRWLDYNDTWLAAEWGHPSDNLGALIAAGWCDEKLCVKDLLEAMIKAYEIQGVLALDNCFNRMGLDHVILVKVASAAVSTHLMGGDKDAIIASLSQAWIDSAPLRTYRHAPNTGSRKSWAAGDATSRGLQFAWMTMQGEMGYPQAIDAKTWGVNDALMHGYPLNLSRPLSCYVMEHILFKVAFPAEFHAQTAVECAIELHHKYKSDISKITSIEVETTDAAMRIIEKTGPLHNPADRDHCLQYMIAVALIEGKLEAGFYEDDYPLHNEVDRLREKMIVKEHPSFTKDYMDPEKRSIGNSVTIHFEDGTKSEKVTVEYPLGHRKRRREAIPFIYSKLKTNLSKCNNAQELISLFQDQKTLENLSLSAFLHRFPQEITSK